MGPSSISDQIDRILHSQTFASKSQLRKLMGMLAKNMDSQSILSPELIIKELWPDEIRTKRSADVATEMNRLRHALKSSYQSEGENDPITIVLPNRAAALNGAHQWPWIVARPRESTLEAELDPGQQVHTIAGVTPTPLWFRPLFMAGGSVVIIIIVGVLGFLFRPTLPAPRVTGSTQVTHDGRDKERLVTDSPRIYFSSYPDINPRLYQVPATGGDAVPVDSSIPGTFVFDISHDRSELLVGSCYVGRPTSECPLWILPVLGRPPRRLGDIAASDATWSSDGKRLAYLNGNNLYTATSGGDEPLKIVSGTAGETLSWPRWSPDGRRLRFSASTQGNGTSVWEVSTNGGELHALLSGWNTPPSECCGSWTPDGRYFLFQSNRGGNTNVWAIREDRSILRKTNYQPVELTTGPTSAGNVVPGTDNRKLYVITARSGELVRYESASQEFAPYLSGISATGVSFSADGKWVTYVAYPEHTLWRSKADGSERLQLTFPPLYVMQPRWSPDGSRIAFMALEPDKPWSVYVISADGGSLERPVPGDHRGADPNWSPDGNRLLFGGVATGEPPTASTLDLKIVDLRSHSLSKVAGSDEMWSPRWSRDGRHILAFTRAADRLMLFDVKSQKWTELAKIHASYPEWSRDGDYVYFLVRSKNTPATVILRIGTRDRKVEQVASLRNFKQPTVDWGGWAGLAPDDSPILLREAGTPEIYALDWDAP
jgi:Tol biopolymer transport system component